MNAEPTKRPDTLLLSESTGYKNHEIACPGCGDRYVHPLLSEMRTGIETYTSPAGERGSWVEIPMSCEICNPKGEEGFSVVFAFHKGQTFLTVLGRLPDWYNPAAASR